VSKASVGQQGAKDWLEVRRMIPIVLGSFGTIGTPNVLFSFWYNLQCAKSMNPKLSVQSFDVEFRMSQSSSVQLFDVIIPSLFRRKNL
jgi:hypothetical protein